ncbi:hypothetical protein [uncultured Sphingomonas sp.]|uniref:hypothetical protein n=1 Tax=uncultured Sphingomonas sp. TaxID=158754 RepID=UPI0025E3B332|nr:hypothetical protein [uncultured Sphingomonas sp.]
MTGAANPRPHAGRSRCWMHADRYGTRMAASEYDLIARAVNFSLAHASQVQGEIEARLQTGAATPDVNALRMLTMQSTILAIGAVQAFEGLLQQKRGWKDAFAELDKCLRKFGRVELANRFVDFRLAINVLKHGAGRSYDQLEAKRDSLPFVVKPKGERFFSEGNVSEGIRLVDANHVFVSQCAEIINEIVEALRSARDELTS